MMFRNVTFFQLGPLHTDNLESRLQEGALKPVALSQMSSCGFVPPIPGDDRLELTFRDRCSFVLDSQLVLRKFKLLDAATDSLPTDTDSLADELRARFTLMSGELRELYAALTDAFVLIPSKSGQ